MNLQAPPNADLWQEIETLRAENTALKTILIENTSPPAELLNALALAIIATNPQGQVVYWSKYAETLYGWTAEEALGKTTLELIATEDSLSHGQAIMHQLQQGQPWSGEYLARHKNGHQFPVYSVITPTYHPNGQLHQLLAYSYDITEKVAQQQKLKNALQEKDILLKEIHHRVKNNLQTISSLLYKQQQFTSDPKIQTLLNDSITRIRSMALIHEKIYRSQNMAHINLADYITDLSHQLFRTYKHPQQNIHLHTQLHPVQISLDRAIPCGLVLNELITNALKYAFWTQKRGDIWLELRHLQPNIELVVRDNGQGLPANFNPNQTASLGLYLVYNLITKQLAGTLEVNPRHPTEFTMRFKP